MNAAEIYRGKFGSDFWERLLDSAKYSELGEHLKLPTNKFLIYAQFSI